jgi:hypothetical protein
VKRLNLESYLFIKTISQCILPHKIRIQKSYILEAQRVDFYTENNQNGAMSGSTYVTKAIFIGAVGKK